MGVTWKCLLVNSYEDDEIEGLFDIIIFFEPFFFFFFYEQFFKISFF